RFWFFFVVSLGRFFVLIDLGRGGINRLVRELVPGLQTGDPPVVTLSDPCLHLVRASHREKHGGFLVLRHCPHLDGLVYGVQHTGVGSDVVDRWLRRQRYRDGRVRLPYGCRSDPRPNSAQSEHDQDYRENSSKHVSLLLNYGSRK